MTPELASAILAGIAVAVSLRAYYLAQVVAKHTEEQAIAAKKAAEEAAVSARLPALIDILREFRRQEFTNTRHYIRRELVAEFPPTAHGIRSITSPERMMQVIEAIHYFDLLCHFVRKELLFPHDIAHFMGKAAEDCWHVLIPYLEFERAKPDQSTVYGENFDYLVRRCNAEVQARNRDAL
jgi:hypothetical protein